MLFSPIMMLEWRYGMSWRLARGEQERVNEEKRKRVELEANVSPLEIHEKA